MAGGAQPRGRRGTQNTANSLEAQEEDMTPSMCCPVPPGELVLSEE